MANDPRHIVALLEEEDADAQAVIEHLRSDEDLRRSVFAWAQEAARVPPSLDHLILEIEGPDLVRSFRQAEDLETGMWILPRIETPFEDFHESGAAQLDALADKLRGAEDPGAVATALGTDFGFGGDRVDYHHPHNSFLTHVIEQRAGLPITVSALWALICERLGFSVRLLAIPGHVFGAYSTDQDAASEDRYVDPFDHGVSVTRDDLDGICQLAGHGDAADFLAGASARQLHQRMALNLVVSYRHRGDRARALVATAMARRPL